MSKKIHNPHDVFFCRIMQHLPMAKDFFRSYLPKIVSQRFDWERLQLERMDTKSIDDQGKHSMADMVFNVCYDHQKPALLLLHTEHFSQLPNDALIRSAQYQLAYLRDWGKAHPNKLLPPIITLIYFHGKKTGGKTPKSMRALFQDDSFIDYLAQPIFIDVTQQSDQEIQSHGHFRGIDLLFKHSFRSLTRQVLKQLILPSLSQETSQIQFDAVQYLLYISEKITPNDIINISKRYFDERTVMNAAEQLKKQGKREGIREGKREGLRQGEEKQKCLTAKRMLNRGFTDKEIIDCTLISLDMLKTLKKDKLALK